MQNFVGTSRAPLLAHLQLTDASSKYTRSSAHYGQLGRWLFAQTGAAKHACGEWNVSCSSSSMEINSNEYSDSKTSEMDPDFQEAMNEVSNKVLKVMMASDEDKVNDLHDELEEMRTYLLQEHDPATAEFLHVLQGLLSHTVLDESKKLEGLYLKAFNRICNIAQSSNWKLAEEGKPLDGANEPTFSTWEDVLGGSRSKSSSPQGASNANSVKEAELYDILEVDPGASASEIKASFRKLALKWHPDVSDEPNAEAKFKALSHAYDVLSDEAARKTYNLFGAKGLKTNPGSGNSERFWTEFKPFKRENKHTKARETSGPASGTSTNNQEPMAGDVVEYPLTTIIKEDLMDGREKGVGLLVSRNIDRGDAKSLPPDQLDLCEIEPMRQVESESNRWMPDEIAYAAFCHMKDLTLVPVTEYDRRFDVWVIDSELSEGCGGPEIVEEIII